MKNNETAKINVKIPYKKYGVIEVEGLDFSQDNIEVAKKLIDSIRFVDDNEIGVKKSFSNSYQKFNTTNSGGQKSYSNNNNDGGVKISDGQQKMIYALGGDSKKKFGSWNEFNDYVNMLRISKDAANEITSEEQQSKHFQKVPDGIDWEVFK